MNFNEIKQKQLEKPEISTAAEPEGVTSALQLLHEHAKRGELGLENTLLKEALAESLKESERLKTEFVKLAKNQNEEIRILRTEVEKAASKFEFLTKNTEKALETLLGTAFEGSTQKVGKSAEKMEVQTQKYCQSLDAAASNAWNQINYVKYIVLVCLIAFVALGGYTSYKAGVLMDELENQSAAVNRVLTGESKYWFDVENQQLYFKRVQQEQNASETR